MFDSIQNQIKICALITYLYKHMEERESQFQFIKPDTNTKSIHNQPASILTACSALQEQIVQQKMIQAYNLFKQLFVQSQYFQGSKNPIFSIGLRKGEEQYLNRLMKLFQQNIIRDKESIFKNINPSNIHTVCINEKTVEDLVQKMSIQIQNSTAKNINDQTFIFICTQISDLSEDNIQYFQKGLAGKRYIAIVPTYKQKNISKLSQQQYNALLKKEELQTYQNYFIQVFDNKEMFCKYMYLCIAKKQIQAYLPAQSIKLLNDLKNKQFTFKDGCRRLIFCIERVYSLRNSLKKQWVDFQKLVEMIQNIIKLKFKNYVGYKRNYQNIIKIILSEKGQYLIPSDVLDIEIGLQNFTFINNSNNDQQIMRDIWINSLRSSLGKNLRQNQQYKIYSDFLLQPESNVLPSKKQKISRESQLGITTINNKIASNSPKHILEQQITKIIKLATANIRIQASQVKWCDIKYQQRISPNIPLIINETVRMQKQTRKLFEFITNSKRVNIERVFAEFAEVNQELIIYLLNSLQYEGLIQFVRDSNHKVFVVHNCQEKKGAIDDKIERLIRKDRRGRLMNVKDSTKYN